MSEAMENGAAQNSISEEELEDFEAQLQSRRRERTRLGRGRGANRRDREMVDSVAREKTMNSEQRRAFGEYIEEIKRSENRGGDVNFTYSELLEIADEFMSK